ncbi:MAG: PEP-CTERM sorting domain-containing protein [Desulfuromonadales bacterium]
MKPHFICRILLSTCFFVIMPLLAFAVPESPDTLGTITSTKSMALLEPGTLLLLALGGGGMLYLNKRKSKS